MNSSFLSKFVITAAIGLTALGSLLVVGISAANGNIETTCHYTNNPANPYQKSLTTEGNNTNGHFNSNGTPIGGHLNDILYKGDVTCPPSTSFAIIDKIIDPMPAPIGGIVNFTVTINLGSAKQGVNIEDIFSSGGEAPATDFVSGSAKLDGVSIADPSVVAKQVNRIHYNFSLGDLSAGLHTLTYKWKIDPAINCYATPANEAHLNVDGVEGHLDTVTVRFSINCASPSPSPSPSVSASPTPTPSPSVSASPSPTASPSPSETPSPTPTPTPTPQSSTPPSGGNNNSNNNPQGGTGEVAGAVSGEVLGSSTLASTGSYADLMTLLGVSGIVSMVAATRKYAQEKA